MQYPEFTSVTVVQAWPEPGSLKSCGGHHLEPQGSRAYSSAVPRVIFSCSLSRNCSRSSSRTVLGYACSATLNGMRSSRSPKTLPQQWRQMATHDTHRIRHKTWIAPPVARSAKCSKCHLSRRLRRSRQPVPHRPQYLAVSQGRSELSTPSVRI